MNIKTHDSLQPGNSGDSLIKAQITEDWMQPNKSVKTEALCYKMYLLDVETQARQAVGPSQILPCGMSLCCRPQPQPWLLQSVLWGATWKPTLQEFQHLSMNLASTKLRIAWPNNSHIGQDSQNEISISQTGKKEKERGRKRKRKKSQTQKIWLFKNFNIISFVLYHFHDYTVNLLH